MVLVARIRHVRHGPTGRHRDAEVRDRLADPHAVDDLRACVGPPTGRIAVVEDLRRPAQGRAAVDPGVCEDEVVLAPEDRTTHLEPEGDAARVGPVGEDDEPGVVTGMRSRRHVR